MDSIKSLQHLEAGQRVYLKSRSSGGYLDGRHAPDLPVGIAKLGELQYYTWTIAPADVGYVSI